MGSEALGLGGEDLRLVVFLLVLVVPVIAACLRPRVMLPFTTLLASVLLVGFATER